MKLFKWQRGRQVNCRYFKFPFIYFRIGKFGFDGYILLYPKEARLPFHRDKINGKMWRMNITLKGIARFGIRYGGLTKITSNIINIFRPDLYEHSLHVFTRTYKLSLGFAIFSK